VSAFGSSRVALYLIAGAAIVLRFAFRELRDRRMHVGRLFIVPCIFAAIALLLVGSAAVAAPQAVLQLLGAVAVAIVLGFGIGSAVGHFTKLRLDERPDFVVVRGSAITVAIWIGAVAFRVAVHLFVPSHDRADTAIANAALFVLLASALSFVRYRIFKLARLARAEDVTAEMTAL
jgi:FtsH-binding integral membrane protein